MTVSLAIELDLIWSDGTSNGTKVTKVYNFASKEVAEEFLERINEREQAQEKDDYYSAFLVEESVDASPDDDVHILSLMSYERLGDGSLKLFMHEETVFLTSEIEAFRTAGIHPSIVNAYDNPIMVEPATLTPEEIDGITGNYYFGRNDPNEVRFMSFNPDAANILNRKYPQAGSRFSPDKDKE